MLDATLLIEQENPNMCQALRELMKEELLEAENKGRREMEAENARLKAELAKRQA